MIWETTYGIFYTYHTRFLSAEVVNVTCNAKNKSITYLHCSTPEDQRTNSIQHHPASSPPTSPHSKSGI